MHFDNSQLRLLHDVIITTSLNLTIYTNLNFQIQTSDIRSNLLAKRLLLFILC